MDAAPLDSDGDPDSKDCAPFDPTRWQWMICYPDHDGDGVGTLPPQVQCEGSSEPPAFSAYGDDEDDTNPAIGAWPGEDVLGFVLN